MSTNTTAPNHASPARPRRGMLRIGIRLALATGTLAVGAALTTAAVSYRHATRRYVVPPHALAVHTDSVTVARGARLARARFCSECHGPTLAGRVMAEEPLLGRIAPPNLTNGRAPAALSDEEWERAVRHGLRADGTALRIMPSHEFSSLTDEDLAAIVAYARALPSSRTHVAPTKLGPLLMALDVAGQVDVYPAARIDHAQPHRRRLTADVTPAYGAYIASSCAGCHGTGFSGGKIPGTPPDWPVAANITPAGIGHYTLGEFARLLRTGVRPDGSRVGDGMPWRFTSALSDTEIAALFSYLRTVPAREYGHR